MIKRHSVGRIWKGLLLAAGLVMVALFMLNASTPGRRVEGCASGCAAAAVERRPGPLRVVSLNMLHGFPSFKDLPLRMQLIAAEIRRLDADVVLLQEAPWTVRTGNGATVMAGKLGFNHLYYRAQGNKYLIFFETGQAILSRFPLEAPAFIRLAPRVNLFESRAALAATAITPEGELTFVTAHLTNLAPSKNLGQAQSLLVFVQGLPERPKVVGGDFNAREDSQQIRLLTEVWTDPFRRLHPGEAGYTCCINDLTASPDGALEKRIDYLFLDGQEIQPVNAGRVFDRPFPSNSGWQWASDHVGVLVELEWR